MPVEVFSNKSSLMQPPMFIFSKRPNIFKRIKLRLQKKLWLVIPEGINQFDFLNGWQKEG